VTVKNNNQKNKMFFTKAGDNGTTRTFACDQKISKSSAVAEALGTLDEINSFLGLCKVKSLESGFLLGAESFAEIVQGIQQSLFIIQAELAGADKTVDEEKVGELEFLTNTAEKILPPIKTFFISGGTELSALFDVARTIARRAERRVVAVADEENKKDGKNKNEKTDQKKSIVGVQTLCYLNRLSSLLYALARLSSHLSGINEESPSYK
jgi:cob(I)alamin adenosyltransferase